ncbi:MAG: hypothetical protein LBL21_04845 [Rickettsiales bacterium]|jgi:uncharacterized protein YdcH (DUF465 family)|nr:hypothetical protein [Rickettsiales bacterium]
MMAEMSVKKQIFDELNAIEAAVSNLKGSEVASKKQTDLEIAILRKQRLTAGEKIDAALGILRALK